MLPAGVLHREADPILSRHCMRKDGTIGLRRSGLCVLLVAMLAGCGKAPPQVPARGPNIVSTITVSAADVPVTAEFVAQTQSSRLVNIQARVSGFLDRRVYTEGSLVKEGQVLFLMDRKPFQAQLDQARAALQQQQAALETTRSNLERTKPLVQQDALSQKDLDDATGQFQQASAAVAQAKAQVVQAELNLSYTTITSPVDGISSYALQADGTYLSTSNSQLTTVAALSPMWVNFSVSENQFQNLHRQVEKGQLKPPADGNFEVEVVLVDGTVFPNKGRITFSEPEFDTKTGTFLVRASVANPKGTLRPNQFVRVRVGGAVRPDAIIVPQRAVQQGPKGHFVWVLDAGGKAENRPVTVGDWHGDGWFVNEGLRPGERVVVDGALGLTPGAAVQVSQAASGADGGGAAGPAATPSK
jgi:membrane fusion protein (multidrug efflux system)